MTSMSERSQRIRRTVNKLPDTVRALVDLDSTRYSIFIGSDPERTTQSGESGADVHIRMYGPGIKGSIKLTSLDSDGLTALKELFDMAFANAQPIVKVRDMEAQQAYEDGDDSYKRLDTIVPRVIVREGTKWEHYPSLLRGPEWIASVGTFITRRVLNLRDSGGEVSYGKQEDIIAAYDH